MTTTPPADAIARTALAEQQPGPELGQWLTLDDIAAAYGVQRKTVRSWIADGRLPAYRLAGTRLIRVKAADAAALGTPIPHAGIGTGK